MPDKKFENRFCISTDKEFKEYLNIKNSYLDKIYDNYNNIDFCAMLMKLLYYSATIKNRYDVLLNVIDEINLKENKIIIFCRHINIQDKIYDLLHNTYSVYNVSGETKNRDKVLNEFKKNGQILILNYGIGSYGLNLQYANYIIYFENIYDYNLLQQSEDRIHRIGQEKNCYYINLYSDFKIEDLVRKNIKSKINTIKWFEDQVALIQNSENVNKRSALKKLFEVI